MNNQLNGSNFPKKARLTVDIHGGAIQTIPKGTEFEVTAIDTQRSVAAVRGCSVSEDGSGKCNSVCYVYLDELEFLD